MNLKSRLSHLNKDSWHAKLVRQVYGEGFFYKELKFGKACPYWWFIVPASPIVAGLKLVLAVIMYLIIALTYVVSQIFALIFGYVIIDNPHTLGTKLNNQMNSTSKYASSNKQVNMKRILPFYAPFVLLLAVVAVLLIATPLNDFLSRTWKWFALGAAILAGLTILGTFYTKILHKPLARWYEANCPPLVWEDNDHSPTNANTSSQP